MKYILNILFISLLIFFSGCTNKTIEYTQTIQQSNTDDDSDDFLDEFEDEMEIKEVYDPLNSYNRVMTSFNDGLYQYILTPVATGYEKVVHKEIRTSIKNFFNNIFYPIRLVNNILQGKGKNAAEETGRFVINTTIGLFGLFDPATSYFDLKVHNEDFGQTLGFWGVGAGPHIVLPFLGPSNLRDMLSLYPDSYASPVDYYKSRGYNLSNNYNESILLKAYEKLNYVSLHNGEYEKLKKDAVDLYPYLRDIYEQYREQQIKE
ncbi:MAG: VacJ family lipoprotein [Campylobacterota bacterium]|nr:VacJ family lipoprotein [Campylobacterota bacterium]